MITISTFLICAVICAVLTRSVRDFAIAHHLVSGPGSSRHLHSIPVPRLGGVAIFITTAAIVPAVLIGARRLGFSPPLTARYLMAFVAPAAIVFLLGLWDDLRGVDARLKLLVQAIAAALLWSEGIRITRLPFLFGNSTLHTVLSLSVTVLWVVWITNAFNLIDGLDGLAAGSALFSTLVICILSLFTGNSPVAFITIGLAGAIAGFLRYNFNPASIFLGDCGSLFIGFLLSAIAIRGSQKVSTLVAVAIPVVSLGLPILDVGVAVVRRFLSHQPLFKADRDHIHHRLLRRGLSHKQTVLVLYSVSAALGVLSLVLLTPGGRLSALILVVIGLVVCGGLQQLRYHEMDELGRVVRRTVTQRKIIANNLSVRRLAEELVGCDGFPAIAAVLQRALEPIGFSGFTLRVIKPLPAATAIDPLKWSDAGSLELFWDGRPMPDSVAWTLTLRLEHKGEAQGALMLHRCATTDALAMDINLFTNSGFTAALSEVLVSILAECNQGSSAQVPLAAAGAAVAR